MQNMYEKKSAFLSLTPKSGFIIERVHIQDLISPASFHYHDSYELYYLYSGERYYFINDKTYHVSKGAFVLINPYEIHKTDVLANSGFDRVLIHFKKEQLEVFNELNVNPFSNLENGIHVISLDSQEQLFIEKLLDNMINEFNNFKYMTDYIKINLVNILLFLNNCKPKQQDEGLLSIKQGYKTIFNISAFINNNYYKNITLDEITRNFYINKFYFSHLFKEVTGFTFIEYLNNIRIKEAKKLLITTTLSIDEIAFKVGYNSNTHFGRVFKKLTGISPLNFRNNR